MYDNGPSDKACKKKTYQRLRNVILDYYGRKCKCCGETIIEFLTIDHMNGHSTPRIKRRGGQRQILREIVESGFPDSIQILCYNCNCAKGVYGECPHNKRSIVNV